MKKIIPKDAKLIPDEAECVFKGVIYDVYHWQQKLFDGKFAAFEMLRRPDTVQAICVDADKILVIKQEQPHRGKNTNFPGGRVDLTDNSTLEAVQREVKEETGMTFAKWKLVKVEQPQAKIEWFIYTYVAHNPTAESSKSLDAGEKIETVWSTIEDVKSLIADDVKHINESRSILETAKTSSELIFLNEFHGKEIER